MKVEFHFDFGSPNAYLCHRVIPSIESRTGMSFTYVPVLIGGVFKATNNVSPAVSLDGIKNKGEYAEIETQRFLKRHGITDFNRNPHFPVNTLLIMRGAIYAQMNKIFEQYVDAVYDHMWSNPKKMDEMTVVLEALEQSGLDAKAIVEGTQDPEVKRRLIENTERSVSMGAFGSPTMFVNDDIYFGKDTLRDVEERMLQG